MEGSGLVGKTQAGALSTCQARRDSFFSTGLSSIFICQWAAKSTQGTQNLMRDVCVCVVTEGFVPSTSSPQTDQHRL